MLSTLRRREGARGSNLGAPEREVGGPPRNLGAGSRRYLGGSVSAMGRGGRSRDRTGHRSVAMARVYTRRAGAFADHAGEGLL